MVEAPRSQPFDLLAWVIDKSVASDLQLLTLSHL